MAEFVRGRGSDLTSLIKDAKKRKKKILKKRREKELVKKLIKKGGEFNGKF